MHSTFAVGFLAKYRYKRTRPKTINSIYRAVVSPILSYACLVWWPALASEKASNLKTVTKIQELPCIGTTSAMITTLTAAPESFCSLIPLVRYDLNSVVIGKGAFVGI